MRAWHVAKERSPPLARFMLSCAHLLELVNFVLCCWSDGRAVVIQERDEHESRTVDVVEFRVNSQQVERAPMLVLEFLFSRGCQIFV